MSGDGRELTGLAACHEVLAAISQRLTRQRVADEPQATGSELIRQRARERAAVERRARPVR